MWLYRCAVAGVTILLAGNAVAARLVRDINAVPIANGTPASHWTALGSTVLFLMDDGVHGEELWRTDGTPAGTTLVKDLNPGSAGAGITAMTVVSGTLYFFANDGTNGIELWRSDGTSSGTHIVADINTGSGDGVASVDGQIPNINGVLYFVATDAAAGTELWRSDGTASGTYRVADICPGACSSAPTSPVVSGSHLLFTADDSTSGRELWTSDGTAAGTHRVADIYSGSMGSDPQNLSVTSAGVFFTADDGSHGRELWFALADGSGAHLVVDLSPGPQSSPYSRMGALGPDVVFGATAIGSNPAGINIYRANTTGVQVLAQNLQTSSGEPVPAEGFVAVGGRLVFEGDPAQGEVWVTDGTAAGTQRLGATAGLVSTTLIGASDVLAGLNTSDGLYFFGYTGAPGAVDMWRTDGTEAGTVRFATLPQYFVTSGLAQFHGRIFFSGGRFGPHGEELWTSDGTPAGTSEFKDLNPGPADSIPNTFAVVGANLYFVATTPNGAVPWVSDGTVDGTVPLRAAGAPAQSAGSQPQGFVVLGNRVVFVADDGVHGVEPWASDGTDAGTLLLSDVFAGPGGSMPGILGSLGSLVLFSATDPLHGTELWATDATPAGTYLVKDINPGTASSNPGSTTFTILSGVAYFPADDGTHGSELWRSDGTTAGTSVVVDVAPNVNGCISDLHTLALQLVFRCHEPNGVFWWVSDGTAAGTRRVTTTVSPTSTSDSVVMNGFLYFGGQATPFTNTTHGQLWRTDGTPAGTAQVVDLNPAASSTSVDLLRKMPGHVLFQYCANDPTASCGLESSDGTAAGTGLISPDIIGGDSAVIGNRLIYAANAPSGLVLRITDGTAEGTINVQGPTASQGFLGSFATVQGHVLFTQVDPVLGPSVWRTDGTASSTVLVADIDPSTQTQFAPFGYTAVGNNVFFQAYEPRSGAELYVIDATTPNAADDVARVSYGDSVKISVLANDGAVSSPIDPTSVHVGSLPANGSATVDSASGVVTYTPNTGFIGSDQFTYIVADTAGHESSPATVFVTVAEPAGPSPGTEPIPPPPPPPSAPPPTGTGGSGSNSNSSSGGSGAISPLEVALLGLLQLLVSTRRFVGPGARHGEPTRE